jgi:hypothetical protein
MNPDMTSNEMLLDKNTSTENKAKQDALSIEF